MSRLKNLLERVRLKGKLIPEPMCSDFTWIPWDNIVLVCIDQKLRDWHIPGPPDYEGEDICYSYYTVIMSDDLCNIFGLLLQML